jgi:hypothetical protein
VQKSVTVTVSGTSTGSGGTGGQADIHINAGGPALSSYQADKYFLNGDSYGSGSTIYDSHRYASGATLRYEIPVANGDYDVTLRWREIYFTQSGMRVFSPVVEGTALGNVDVYAAAQSNPYSRTVHVTVSDASLSIAVGPVVQNPMLSAIDVVASGTTQTPPSSPAPTLSFSANPSSVTSGSNSTLTWSTTDATSCTASGAWSGSVGTSGTRSVGPLSSTSTYSLSCSGAGGSVQKSVTVTVGAAPPPTPTVSLSASPTSVQSGSGSMLSWSSTNATSCTASGAWSGSKASSGSQSTGALSSSATYTLACSNASGSASKSVQVAVTASTPSTVTFPLHVESGKRYLIDAAGKPFLLHGDTPWDLISTLTKEQAAQYLEDRRAKGFNTVLVELMEHYFSPNPPRNAYGDAPFLTAGDYSTPNEAYFAHAAWVIDTARQKGMLVLLTPSYMGYGGGQEGWYAEMQANGATKLRAYGRYLANRFASYPNILWVHGGDYNPPDRSLLDAIPNGIRDVNATTWLHTFHGARHSSALSNLGTASWLNVNDIYTDQTDVVSWAFSEYSRSTMPYFLIEARYENEQGGNDLTVREQAYQAVLSGAMGHLMGNSPLWYFGSGWQTAMQSGGSTTLQYLRSLLEARNWWQLQPDTGGTLVTSGVGSGETRTAAARASDGSYALIYVPSTRAVTVNLGQLSGPHVNARWYNPKTGAYSAISGSPFTASGSQSFTSASGDWVLVLESTP